METIKEAVAEKSRVLSLLGDSHMRMRYKEFQKMVEEIGFVRLYREDIPTNKNEPYKNIFEIYWNAEKGCLLRCESYWGWESDNSSVNSSEVYYCWKPNDPKNAMSYTSSGGFVDPESPKGIVTRDIPWEKLVYEGHKDAREGLRRHLDKLENNGTFLKKWVKMPFLWLCNYMETKDDGYDYQSLAAAKIRQFPKEVQEAIQFKE
jgi:hypothetical protein